MIELSNGCICCTLREDLLTSLSLLAAENLFDHVLIESSGISEPLPVAETFTFRDKATGLSLNDVASLHNLVTVVDAASIFEQLSTVDTLVDRGWHEVEGDKRTVAHLLCDQCEFADLLLINKCDLVTDTQRNRVEAFLHRVNPTAEIMRTRNSVLDPTVLLGKGRFSMARAVQHPQWLAEAREGEHVPETIEYGISSFVFRAKRPFHPERLHAALGSRPRPGALAGLLRLKGFGWLATQPRLQAHAALAGTQFTLASGPAWWAAIPRHQWPDGLKKELDRDGAWDAEHGDRRTELVCIWRELDAEAARAQLAACLLTDDEMASGQQSWLALPDPFPLWAAGVVGMARGRLQEERKAWRKDHPTGFVAKPLMLPDGTQDILNWAVVLPGKEGTIWEGARIPMKMQFSEDYPNQPPVCTFKPIASTGEPLFHPNVGPSGKIGLSLLDATKGGRPHTTHAHRHLWRFMDALVHSPLRVCSPGAPQRGNRR